MKNDIDFEIYEKYINGDINFTNFCLKHNMSSYYMGKLLKENGLKFRKNVLQETTVDDFFNNIDNEIKSYLLGFYVADGSISQNNRLTISVAEKDIEIIYMFKNNISPHYKITKIKSKENKKTGFISKPMCKISISSKEMCQRLRDLGIGENKTYNMSFKLDIIPDNLFVHFIRGLFDGDGTVYCGVSEKKVKNKNDEIKVYKSLNCNWSIISHNHKFIEDLFYKIKNLYGIECNIINDKRGNKLLMINKKSDFIKWREILYGNANYFLERKRIKYYNFDFSKKYSIFVKH